MEHLREAYSLYVDWFDAIPLAVMDMTQSLTKNEMLFNGYYLYN
tara:strand:- start:254 stop:385 length:132 start_codon:yes stop_codon:yes gene_type:complete